MPLINPSPLAIELGRLEPADPYLLTLSTASPSLVLPGPASPCASATKIAAAIHKLRRRNMSPLARTLRCGQNHFDFCSIGNSFREG
jgi:hypothetical protein